MITLRSNRCLRLIAVLCISGSVCAAPYKTFKDALRDAETKSDQNDTPAAAFAATAAQGLAQTPAETTQLVFLRARMALGAGDSNDAMRQYNAIFADKTVAAAKRFEAFLIMTGIEAATEKTVVSRENLDKAVRALAAEGLTTADRYAAFNNAAQTMARLGHYEVVHEFLALADSLMAQPEAKVYLCKYMDQVPLGAGGWLLSDFIKDPANREDRFGDYDRKSAGMLFADVATTRSVSTGNEKKDHYIKNTGFYMAYDNAGWHTFVLGGEPGLGNILADGGSAGGLEMYFSPGAKGEPYFQWTISLPKGRFTCYTWNSPHRFYRLLDEYMRSETVTAGENIGTYIFIPWEAVYDKLPLDGQKWPFGVIRWSPAGGITWGGKVHEIGKWGQVEWEKPTPEQAHLIRKNVARKAWAKYRGNRGTQTTHWDDPMLGDPKFAAEVLAPAIQRLDRYGEMLKNPDALTSEQVTDLYTNAVPDWMEFDYLVSELRRKYLENELVVK